MTNTISLHDMLNELTNDPEIREDWERTVLARAVANEVVRYRRDHDLSQRALASMLGVSQAVVGRLELGEHEPKLSTLSRLARVLGMRFTIAIHPLAESAGRRDATVERITTDDVELIVSAG
ncbi:MAG TPA: helix-turn-helix transcriptional regulator [Thermomicrobiales bacterium]|nr:helix-turn-helix transcriptional regulator [Thermomicrobiales bacterium]